MFKNYMYVSGTSKVLVEHFKSYYLSIKEKMHLKKSKDKILDIASNDGTLIFL